MNKKNIILFHLLFFSTFLYAQQEKEKYTLFEIVEIAKTQSPSSLQAATTRENRYWNYRYFKSQYYPQLGFDGVLPNFTRSVIPIQQDDGSYLYGRVFTNESNVNFRLTQNIAATGGEIFINSSLSRADDFAEDRMVFSGNPVEIGINQPLFSFNSLYWNKKIEPLRYEESKRQYAEDLENISVNITREFFNLMLAQISQQIALKNLANNDTIYKIAKGRYNLGKIGEDQLLQLELSVMNARQEVAQAKLDLQTYSLRLRSFAGMNIEGGFELILPENIPQFMVSEELALEEAFRNRQDAVAFRRRQLEADMEIARAKGNAGLQMDIFARVGLSNLGDTFRDVYSEPGNHQVARVGFEIPVLDWGRRKSSVKTAEANQKLVQYTVAMDEINFREEVLTQVRQLNMLRESIKISRKADEIANKRYEIAKMRYLIGKIDITNLNIALTEKDEAKRNYIQSLRDFWIAYYNLRRITLYNFEENVPIVVPSVSYR